MGTFIWNLMLAMFRHGVSLQLLFQLFLAVTHGAEKEKMMELKGIEEGHPADADLSQPMAWQGKSGSRPGANRREKRGCHYFCRDWHLKTAELNIMGELSRPTPPASPRTMMRRNNMSTAIIQIVGVLRCPDSAA